MKKASILLKDNNIDCDNCFISEIRLQRYFLLKILKYQYLKLKVSDRDFSVTMDSYFNVKWKDQRLQSPTLFRWVIEAECILYWKRMNEWIHNYRTLRASLKTVFRRFSRKIILPGEIPITWHQARIWLQWTSISYQGNKVSSHFCDYHLHHPHHHHHGHETSHSGYGCQTLRSWT